MAQIFPEDRGMNYAIVYGDRAARLVLDDLRCNGSGDPAPEPSRLGFGRGRGRGS